MIADRCEINRQIRADNKMLRELKAKVAKLAEAVEKSIPIIAETLEVSPKTVDYRIQQALKQLRIDLKDYLPLLLPLLFP